MNRNIAFAAATITLIALAFAQTAGNLSNASDGNTASAPAGTHEPDVSPASIPTTGATPASSKAVADILPSKAYLDRVFAQTDLMESGKSVTDPTRKGLIYYVAHPSLLWQGPSNPVNYRKHSGLFISKDGGKTWQVLSWQFDFKELFIHPLTGELFAIINYQWLENDKDGFLQHCYANKIIRSPDGHRWIDITRGPGYIATLLSIFQDPNHPRRVCVRANVIRNVILQSKDDEYSGWEWLRESDWPRTHPTSQAVSRP